MLVLGRKVGERIIQYFPNGLPAGTRIIVMPVSTKGEYVRVGIEAPADCTIYREEIAPDPEPAAA